MAFVEEKTAKGKLRRRRNSTGFKGIRMRKWGRWVSEIRVPKSRSRIWLGSYDAPEKAARAYDAALYCLRGPEGDFNFPDERRPEFPGGMPPLLSKTHIKAIAASFSSCPDINNNNDNNNNSSSSSSSMLQWGCMGGLQPSQDMWSGCGSGSLFGVLSPDEFSPESFLIGDPYMVEPS